MLEQFMKVLNFHAITAITKATQASSLEKHINTAHEVSAIHVINVIPNFPRKEFFTNK